MAQLNLLLLVISLSLSSNLTPAESSLARAQRDNRQTMAYIKTACQTTLYQKLCMHCLARFANSRIQSQQQLTHIALSMSLSRALHTRGYLLTVAKELTALKNHRDRLTVQDCQRQINDSVDQLGLSIKELGRLNRIASSTINDDFLWHISNVETWVSTALTDAATCVDSFPGHRMSKMKATIKVKALNVAQITSNALAIFHSYAAEYQAAAAATKKP